MTKNFIPFLIVALIITATVVAADFVFQNHWPEYNLTLGKNIAFIFLFIFVTLHGFLLRTAINKPTSFVNAFLTQLVVKMLLLLSFFVVFTRTHPEQKMSFLAIFALAYVLHTINETLWILKYFKKK